ncbi:MAG: DUF2480 family protein [Bacteroidetes bacterium]|nr:DUF2480 family protein [Bacteroidota bacterium]
METIRNKVAESGIITIDPELFYPSSEVVEFDLKPFLFRELILKEKDFRESLKNFDFSAYAGKNAAIFCSVDAIIPVWAFMLAASYLQQCTNVVFGNKQAATEKIILENLSRINLQDYSGKRIVIKGCGEKDIPPSVYVKLTSMLQPIAKSLMYGEPCSTVPVFKN